MADFPLTCVYSLEYREDCNRSAWFFTIPDLFCQLYGVNGTNLEHVLWTIDKNFMQISAAF